MAGVKRIAREDVENIRDDEDPWKVIMRPEKRRRVAAAKLEETADEPYVYVETLDEFDPRLSFKYSIELYDQQVDWRKKKGEKGQDAFRTYSRFQLEDTDLEVGDIVFVKNTDEEPENENTKSDDTSQISMNNKQTSVSAPAPLKDWIAKVLECRAFNPEQVFLRVLWLYRPEDLLSGRQPWHGSNEVFPSNSMQVIDALTVQCKAGTLTKWDEKAETKDSDNDDGDGLVWRQTCLVLPKGKKMNVQVLGKLEKYCTCEKPANPDHRIVECKACGQWMHDTCLEEEVTARQTTAAPVTPTKDQRKEEGEIKQPPQSANTLSGAVRMFASSFIRATTPSKAVKAKEKEKEKEKHKEREIKKEVVDWTEGTAVETLHCLFCGEQVEQVI